MATDKKGYNTKIKKRLIKRLQKHYRLVVMNDDNFEIKTSIKLNPLNVIFIGSGLSIFFAGIIILLLLFTPLRQIVLGDDDDLAIKRGMIELRYQTDSLHHIVGLQNSYIENINRILNGDVDTLQVIFRQSEAAYDTIQLEKISALDSQLRAELATKQQYGILVDQDQAAMKPIDEAYFFPPVEGIVVKDFDKEFNHFGIDVVADEGTAIKSVLDGKVIFTGWTLDDGHIISIQHRNNLISIYKHNSVLLKKVGTFVRAGDVIAIIGNSGDLSFGPHLHFEMWHDMIPVNPSQYIIFNLKN